MTADAAIEWLQHVKPPFLSVGPSFRPAFSLTVPRRRSIRLSRMNPDCPGTCEERSFPEQATARAMKAINHYDGEVLYVDKCIGWALARGARDAVVCMRRPRWC